MVACDGEVTQGAEICKEQCASGIGVPIKAERARSGADAALERIAAHASPSAHGAFFKCFCCCSKCRARMFFCNVQAAYVIKMAVITFHYNGVYGACFHADVIVAFKHIFHKRCGNRAHGKCIRKQDGGFKRAELLHLHKPCALSKPVDHMRRSDAFVVEQISSMRQNCGHSRMDIPRVQRFMSNPHTGHLCDQIAFTMLQIAELEIIAAFHTHVFFSPCFVLIGLG